MTIPIETIEELVRKFRDFSPADLAPLGFEANDVFFKDFESFKLPLIAYLSDKVEEAMRNTPDGISEEFLRGYLDGSISIIRLLADLKLVKNL